MYVWGQEVWLLQRQLSHDLVGDFCYFDPDIKGTFHSVSMIDCQNSLTLLKCLVLRFNKDCLH